MTRSVQPVSIDAIKFDASAVSVDPCVLHTSRQFEARTLLRSRAGVSVFVYSLLAIDGKGAGQGFAPAERGYIIPVPSPFCSLPLTSNSSFTALYSSCYSYEPVSSVSTLQPSSSICITAFCPHVLERHYHSHSRIHTTLVTFNSEMSSATTRSATRPTSLPRAIRRRSAVHPEDLPKTPATIETGVVATRKRSLQDSTNSRTSDSYDAPRSNAGKRK